MKNAIKSLVVLVVMVLILASVPFSKQKVSAESPPNKDSYSTESPIVSIETGETIGTKTINTSIEKSELASGEENIVISSEIVNTYLDGKVEIDHTEDFVTMKNGEAIEFNGDVISSKPNDTKYTLSPKDLEKIKPLAAKFNSGEFSYEEYIDAIKKEGIITTGNGGISLLGGLSYVTWYQKNSYDGGYDLRGAQMNGIWKSSLNALMLDSKAVKSGTMKYKHNFTSGSQGGLVSSFMSRADNVSSARSTLLLDAAALAGALGVAALTVATILGAVTAIGAAGVLAARMVSTSQSAHNDIDKAYDLIKQITDKSPMAIVE